MKQARVRPFDRPSGSRCPSTNSENGGRGFRTKSYEIVRVHKAGPAHLPLLCSILFKPTAAVPHEGGQRFKPESQEYAVLKTWVAAGMPNDSATAPSLKRIQVRPTEQVLVEPTRELQLQVRAEFSDGSAREVTSL